MIKIKFLGQGARATRALTEPPQGSIDYDSRLLGDGRITYRSKSAVREVGKALGMEESLVKYLSNNIAWWDRDTDIKKRIETLKLKDDSILTHFFELIQQILGFPRHLSQHTGGFVISESKISDLVPLENASMANRTLIQWDKEDLLSGIIN